MITSLSSCGYVKILTCWQYGLAVKLYKCDKKIKEFIKSIRTFDVILVWWVTAAGRLGCCVPHGRLYRVIAGCDNDLFLFLTALMSFVMPTFVNWMTIQISRKGDKLIVWSRTGLKHTMCILMYEGETTHYCVVCVSHILSTYTNIESIKSVIWYWH